MYATSTPRRTVRPAPAARRAAGGFALIEVLIAILIFSLAVLGLVGLQVTLMRATTSAKFRADAAYLASDLVGRMWADTANLVAYRDSCNTHVACKQWKDKLAATLPSGTYSLSICSDPTTCADTLNRVQITINWVVPQEGSHSFTTTTSINANS